MIVTPEEENIQTVRILIQGLNHIIFILSIASITGKLMEREMRQNENRLFLICLCKLCKISFQLLNISAFDYILTIAPGLRAEAINDIIIGIDVIRNACTLNIILLRIVSVLKVAIRSFMITGSKIRMLGIVFCVGKNITGKSPVIIPSGARIGVIAAEAHGVKFINSKLTGYGIEPVG